MSHPPIELSFLGGAGGIGASCALLEVAGTAVVVDCGVRFRAERNLPDLDMLSGRRIDAVVLTHAHSDHSGALPLLHEAFPDAPIYTTPPTADLVAILQRDALRIMAAGEAAEGEIPLYAERQVEALLAAIRPVHHGSSVEIGTLRATWLPASHILGASMIHFETPGGHLLFTGDYSVSAQRSVPALAPPRLPVDILVTESTYGDRMHSDRQAAEERLLGSVGAVLEGGGRVLIPAFAIGRAQEVLLILQRARLEGRLPDVPVFVDELERRGLARRDDHRRGMIWSEVKHAPAGEEEEALARRLTDANPKGALTTYCQRRGLEPPRFERSRDERHRFVVQVSASVGGDPIDVSATAESSHRLAEQMAAEELLLRLSGGGADRSAAIELSEERLAELKRGNPKTALFELCAKRKLREPHFEVDVLPLGYAARWPWADGGRSNPISIARRPARAPSRPRRLSCWSGSRRCGASRRIHRAPHPPPLQMLCRARAPIPGRV